MHVSVSLYLANTTHLHSKIFKDVVVSYQLYNPESFKESKIKYFQLENPFLLQIRFTEQMMLISLIEIDICVYTYI